MNTLQNFPVLLSASLPDEQRGTSASDSLYDLLVVLTGGILRRGGILVFGGHPTVTPLIHRVAGRTQLHRAQIRLHQLRRFEAAMPMEARDAAVFGEIAWTGEASAPVDALQSELAQMRNRMAEESKAAIFVGGKTQGFLGQTPGIIDEFRRFRSRHPLGPAYLLGVLGGATAMLASEQIEEHNTLGYAERELLHETGDVDLAASLVLMDLERQAARLEPR